MKLTRKQWMMLAVLVSGAFVTVLNQTLVTPALRGCSSRSSRWADLRTAS